MKSLLFFLLLISVTIGSKAQSSWNTYVEAVYADTTIVPTQYNSIDSVKACDTVYFVVGVTGIAPNDNFNYDFQMFLDGNYVGHAYYDTLRNYPASNWGSGFYKAYFKIPCNSVAGTIHQWDIGNSALNGGYYSGFYQVYAPVATGIFQAALQNKQGEVTIYNLQGELVKTGAVSDYMQGLKSKTLYIYSVVYSDGTTDKGKFMIE